MAINKGKGIDALEQRKLREIELAEANFKLCYNAADFLQYAKNLSSRGPHLAEVQRRALDVGLTMKYDPMLPPADKEQDLHPQNLRDFWLQALKITGHFNIRIKQMLLNRGYLGSYVQQISDVARIGTGGFLKLKEHDAIQYSAEFVMYNYFNHMLSDEQKNKIEEILGN